MKKILLLIILIVTIAVPLQSRAAIETYKLLEPLPCIDQTQPCINGRVEKVELASYVGYLFRLIIALAGAIAVFRITWGGFKYMTTDAVFGKQEGKKEIKDAIYGLIMIFASYLILRTIDPRLVEIKTEITPIQRADEVNIDSLFTDITAREAILNQAAADTARLEEQARLLREQRAQASTTEAVDRISQQLLQIERQRSRINFQATLESRYMVVSQALSSNTESVLSDEFKNTVRSAINGVDASLQRNIQQLKNLGDIEGAEEFEQKRKYYVALGNNDLAFLDDKKKINQKINGVGGYAHTAVDVLVPDIVDPILPDSISYQNYKREVKAMGTKIISDLRQREASLSLTDQGLSTAFKQNIATQIKEIEEKIKGY